MGMIDFFAHGVDGDIFGDFIVKAPDFRMKGKAAPYEADLNKSIDQRIQNVVGRGPDSSRASEADIGNYLVDACVFVYAEKPETREQKQDFWAEKRNIAILTGSLSVVGLIGAGIVLAVETTALAITAASVAFFVFPFFAAFSFYRASQAQGQIDELGVHPAYAFANQRTEAYRQGIFYAYEHKLDKILYPEEIIALYAKSLAVEKAVFDQNIESPKEVKFQIVTQFIRGSVLHEAIISYAFEKSPLLAFSKEYERFKETSDVALMYAAQCHALNKNKEERLAPYTAALEAQRTAIDDHYRPRYEGLAQSMRLHKNSAQSQEEHQRIYTEWTQATRRLQAIYDRLVDPINLFYSAQKRTVDEWRDDQIHKQQNVYCEQFFLRARSLLDRAYAAYHQQGIPPVYMMDSFLEMEDPPRLPVFVESAVEIPVGEERPYQAFLAAVSAARDS